MEAIFLLIWFYLYAGLMFGTVSNTASLFPKWGFFWQITFWPVFLKMTLPGFFVIFLHFLTDWHDYCNNRVALCSLIYFLYIDIKL